MLGRAGFCRHGWSGRLLPGSEPVAVDRSPERLTHAACSPGIGLDEVAEPQLPIGRSWLPARRVPGQEPVPPKVLGDLGGDDAVPGRDRVQLWLSSPIIAT